MTKCALVLSLVLFCGGVGFTFPGTFTVLWSRCTDPNVYDVMYFGLYKICVQTTSDDLKCAEYPETKSYLIVVRLLDHTAVAMAVISTLLCFLHAYKISKAALSKPLLCFVVISGICSVILQVSALALYGCAYEGELPNIEGFDLYVSFALKVIAAVILLLASLVATATIRQDKMVSNGRVLQTQPAGGVTVTTTQHAVGHPSMPMAGYPSTVLEQPPPYYPGTFDYSVLQDHHQPVSDAQKRTPAYYPGTFDYSVLQDHHQPVPASSQNRTPAYDREQQDIPNEHDSNNKSYNYSPGDSDKAPLESNMAE